MKCTTTSAAHLLATMLMSLVAASSPSMPAPAPCAPPNYTPACVPPVPVGQPAGYTLPPGAGAAVADWIRPRVSSCNDPARRWIRMVFHDAITGSMDASVQYELDRDGNSDAHFDEELAFYKEQLPLLRASGIPGTTISLSDMIAVGGVVAVKVCGGPDVPIGLGRVDATCADNGTLPAHDIAATQSANIFGRIGLNAPETVAVIIGGHSTAFMVEAEETMPGSVVPAGFDTTPDVFDNVIFQQLQSDTITNGTARIQSDYNLARGPRSRKYVKMFAENSQAMFANFASGYAKMCNAGQPNLSAPTVITASIVHQ